jgi:hypothetical protein
MTYEDIELILDEEIAREKDVKVEGRRYEDIAIDTITNIKIKNILKRTKMRIKQKMTPPEQKKKYI